MSKKPQNLNEKVKQLIQNEIQVERKDVKSVKSAGSIKRTVSDDDGRRKPADPARLEVLAEGRRIHAQKMREAKEAKRKQKEAEGIANEYSKPHSLRNKLKVQSDKIDALDEMIKRLSDMENVIKGTTKTENINKEKITAKKITTKKTKKDESEQIPVIESIKKDEIKVEKVPNSDDIKRADETNINPPEKKLIIEEIEPKKTPNIEDNVKSVLVLPQETKKKSIPLISRPRAYRKNVM